MFLKKKSSTFMITISAMLIAMSTILSFVKIPITSFIEIRFESIPVACAGALFGPFGGAAVGIASDILSCLIKPTGVYFPGFTITAAISGIIYGLFLHKKRSLPYVILSQTSVTVAVGMLGNSYLLSFLYGTAYSVVLATRLPSQAVMLVINSAVIFCVCKLLDHLKIPMGENRSIKYLESLPKFSPKSVCDGTASYDLDSIRILLKYLGDPQDKLQYVHIAGTNGKGSTVSFISSILIKAGYKTGIYTSPFLIRFNERIKINNTNIPDSVLNKYVNKIRRSTKKMRKAGYRMPSEFEMVCAVAFLWFNDSKCDIVVLETGLGGRFDATNVISSPEVCVIATIGYDHMEILGNTLEEIASEKAGIIKKGADTIIYPEKESIKEIFENKCNNVGSLFHMAIFSKNITSFDIRKTVFDIPSSFMLPKGISNAEIRILGLHQVKNASLAAETCGLLIKRGFNLSYDDITEGLKNTTWPGRFELLSQDPCFLIDGAHNAEGVATLKNNLEIYFPGKKIIFIVGILKDKNYERMIDEIIPIASAFYTVAPDSPRALPSDILASLIKSKGCGALSCDTIKSAVNIAVKNATTDSIICSFGSLYYIGQVRTIVLEKNMKHTQNHSIFKDNGSTNVV